MSALPDTSLAKRPRPVYPSDLSRSARRRAEKEALRTGRQQEAQEVACRLEQIAKAYPDYADLLNSTALRIRTRGNSSPDREADTVLNAIVIHEARELGEIVTDTGMLRADVSKTLLALIAAGLVKEVKPAHGGPLQYFPTGKQCGDVLP